MTAARLPALEDHPSRTGAADWLLLVVPGVIWGASFLFIAIVAAFLARRAPSRGVIVGLAVGLTGAILVAWPTIGEGRSSVEGVLLILAALVSYGFALNIARPLQQRYGALPVIWRAQALALLLTAPLGLPEMLDARWTPGPVLALLALGFGVPVHREAKGEYPCAVAFVKSLAEARTAAKAMKKALAEDGIFWLVYPKGTSKKDRGVDVNRDTAYASLKEQGLEGVAMVAIDDDWSAMRNKVASFCLKAP